MQSALIVHSDHTKDYAEKISRRYKDVKFLEIAGMPTKDVLCIENDKDIVVGVGGGSVIDVAKIISKDKRCIAIPTTAAGAAMTPYATIWGEEKISVSTKKPILWANWDMEINLPHSVLQSTIFDAISHAVESFWSRKANKQSRRYSKDSLFLINNYFIHKEDDKCFTKLILAGNLAGQAIAITKTNIVHAVSYPITLKYGISHGLACGMLLPYFIKYMDFSDLMGNEDEAAIKINSPVQEFIMSSNRIDTLSGMKDFDAQWIADKAMKYDKFKDGPKEIDKKSLVEILVLVGKEVNAT